MPDDIRQPTGPAPGSDPPEREASPEPRTGLGVRRFGEAEISRILRSAVELQERAHSVAQDAGRGLTLDEIRQVAQEAGIDPRFVDLAVSEEDGPLDRKESALAGGAYGWRFHMEVQGEIDDDGRGRILRAIRSVMGQKGDFEDVYGRMEWSHDEGLGPTILGIQSRDGRTEVDVTAMKSSEPALLFGVGIPFGGVFGGAALASLLGLSGGAVLPVMGATSVASYGVARLVWRARSGWWERRLRRLVERVSSIAQEFARLPAPDEDR